MSNMNSSLPDDLILMDILMRLSLRSLIRFRSVSKGWNSSLRDSTFASLHLKHPLSSHNTEEYILFLECCKPRPIKASFLSGTQTTDQSEDVSVPFLGDFSTNSDCRIYGPCDGLVCLYKRDTNNGGRDTIAVWNPSTREIRDISKVSHDSLLQKPKSTDFGIGFDGTTNDYKVVCVASYPDNQNRVEVYSLNSDSWREIDSIVPIPIYQKPKSSMYSDGFYYWPTVVVKVEEGQAPAAPTILSFDMTNEVFDIISLPPNGNHESELDSVINYKGSVAAICRTNEWSYPNQLWVMNKENKRWKKRLDIDLGGRVLGWCERSVILDIPRSPGTHLVSYDCAKNNFKYQELDENPSGVQAVIYKGSLVSPSKKISN